NQHYADIAASIQKVTEEVLLTMARAAYEETGLTRLCMAGGVALNSVANGRIIRGTPFEELYVHPAAGDGGAAVGAALVGCHDLPARSILYVVDDKPDKRAVLPAITHVDGTGRLQTVQRETNPRYYRLIETFGQATGVPVVLNTSFNLKGEPIVNTPAEAYNTFSKSGMDVLAPGDCDRRCSAMRTPTARSAGTRCGPEGSTTATVTSA